MSRVEEIEAAIEGLAPQEWSRLAEWFREREQARWDEQIDRDFRHSATYFLFQETEDEASKGLLRKWPDP